MRLLSNLVSEEGMAYPDGVKANIRLDDDLKLLFQDIELPGDVADIEKELLKKCGMTPDANSAKRKAILLAQVREINVPSKPKEEEETGNQQEG